MAELPAGVDAEIVLDPAAPCAGQRNPFALPGGVRPDKKGFARTGQSRIENLAVNADGDHVYSRFDQSSRHGIDAGC